MNTAKRLLLGGLAAAVIGGQATAQPPAAPPAAPPTAAAKAKVDKTGALLVPLGGIVQFTPAIPGTPRRQIKSIVVENEGILSVAQDQDIAILQLSGKASGVTRLTLILNDGSKAEFEVVVQPDYELLKKVIQKAVPTASVDVIAGVGTSIILTGNVNRPEDAETVLSIARAAGGAAGGSNVINAIQVGGLQHVQIEVVFASVNRSESRRRGADFIINGTNTRFASTISGLLSQAGAISSNANLSVGVVPANFIIALQALRGEGLAKFLSEPKIVTQSGRPANIVSGGQQAVLSASGGGLGSISVALERVGTRMDVLPIVYGNGKIYLEVSPSVRNVNNGFGIQTTSGFSPGFSEQSVSASVMLESGQTFAIGGLLETTTAAQSSKVPYIGDLPFVGTLFSSVSHSETESELLILVTPRLVDALDCNQLPKRVPGRETRNADDYELFLEGLLEAPRGQRQIWNGRCYQAAYKCDPTYGMFPCKGNVCGGGVTPAAGGCNTCAPTTLPGSLPPAYTAPALVPVVVAPVVNVGGAAPQDIAPVDMVPPTTSSEPAGGIIVPGPLTPTETPTPAPLAPGQN